MRITLVCLLAAAALVACSSDQENAAPPPSPVISSVTPSPSPTPVWAVGVCSDTRMPLEDGTPAPDPVPCADSRAAATVEKLLKAGIEALKGCPAATDGFVAVAAGTACLVNREAPHPGEPGEGGGVLRAGDCAYVDSGRAVIERPCYDRRGPGKVLGFQAKKRGRHCDASTAYHVEVKQDWRSRPWVCFGVGWDTPEDQVGPEHAKGTCLTKPRTERREDPLSLFGTTETIIVGGLDKVSCSSKKAWGRVVTHVNENQDCPAWAGYEVESYSQSYGIGPRTYRYPSTSCILIGRR